MSLLRLTRRLAPIVGSLSLAVLLAAGPYRAAIAQEAPSEEFVTILGTGTSDTGRFTVINGSAATKTVDLEALSDDGDIGLAFGDVSVACRLFQNVVRSTPLTTARGSRAWSCLPDAA